jgi:type II secretory pathway component PulC
VQDEQPAGFTITNVEPKSAFAKMGLRSGDSIMSLNGEAITGPEDADKFFQKLREGDDVTIKVKKGKGLRRRTRVMRLYVE